MSDPFDCLADLLSMASGISVVVAGREVVDPMRRRNCHRAMPTRARWIQMNFAETLASIAGRTVAVIAKGGSYAA